ncbi:MAG: sterol desaturase family protein [Chitinophagaceae bacterium]
MQVNFIGFSIPFFIGLILLEFFISRKKGLEYFNLHRSIANISIGIAERLTDVFIAGIFYFIYDRIQHKYGLFTIKPGVLLWIVLFILTDFIWYWYHRKAHEINLFWAAHIVHHQSEDFNYTASTRITVFQAVIRTGFWSVLPFIGFPASMITSLLLVHGVYPFFIHTRVIGELGILEYIFVTPSHHRVHHGSNEKYLDKNYGDVLIIWDKIFGTFQKEEEEPTYGLTKPLNSYSFLWQHFHFPIELWLSVKKAKGFKNKIKVIFSPPSSIDPSLRKEAERIFSIHQVDAPMGKPLNRYVIWQMIILLTGLTIFIVFENFLSVPLKFGFAIITVLTLINCGAIMEQKQWIFLIEFLRLGVLLLFVFYSYSFWQWKLVCIASVLVILLYHYGRIKRNYLAYVYR